MGWILFGFLTGLCIEGFFRVASNYERVERAPQKRVQVSLPWYGWGAVGYGLLKSKKRGK